MIALDTAPASFPFSSPPPSRTLNSVMPSPINSLTHLRLCRLPTTNQELAQIALRFHVDQAALAALLSDSSEDVIEH